MSEYLNSIIGEWNTDEYGNPSLKRITNEIKQVDPVNLCIVLEQYPSEYNKVLISGMYEIPIDEYIKNENQFKVDYSLRKIYFHPLQAGKYIAVTEYWGRGRTLLGAEMISTEVGDGNKVISTLRDNIVEIKGKVAEYDIIYDNYAAETTNTINTALDNKIGEVDTEMEGHRVTVNQLKIDYDNATHFTLVTSGAGYFTATSNGVGVFQIPVEMFNPLIDVVSLHYCGEELKLDINYSLLGAEVTLLDWTLDLNEKIYIKVLRGVKTVVPVGTNGGDLMLGSITQPKLALDVQDKISKVPLLETQLENITPLSQSYKNIYSGNLRIAYHFNYENNQEKIDLLKSLGFNCIYMYLGFSWRDDQIKMKAFLDRMLLNGIYVILPIYPNYLTSNNSAEYTLEQNFVSLYEKHPAVVGFSTYDEPISAGYSMVNLNLIYTRIKEKTNKDVFLTEHDNTLTNMITNWSSDCFDVLCIDNYTNILNSGATTRVYDTPEKRKAWLFESLTFFKNLYWTKSPKRIIPVLPMFSLATDPSANFGLPTIQEIREYIDIFALFGFSDYGAFAFDVSFQPSLLGDTIDTSQHLKELCTITMAGLYQSKQTITTIKPKGFKLNKNYISSVNMEYNSTGFDKLSVIGTSASNSSIIFRVDVDSPSNKLCVTTRLQNRLDMQNRVIFISYSVDGTNFIDSFSRSFGTGIDHVFSNVFTIPNNLSAIYVKVEIENNGHLTDGNLGITLISATLV